MSSARTAIAGMAVLCGALLAAGAAWRLRDDPGPAAVPGEASLTDANLARGAYLAKAGNCLTCHTTRGGAAFAGGRVLDTPFGQFVTPNLTPERDTGLGAWSADQFWQALHNGRGRDGRLLYPAFPYTNYTLLTRSDSDALYAYFQSLPPLRQANGPHRLRFPYDQPLMLAAWRALYFTPGVYRSDGGHSAQWNRGAYLVEGLGHCNACHSERNGMGALQQPLAGGLIPMLGWYAPSLTSDAEAGLGGWNQEHIVQLLRTGVSPRAAVFGPMTDVVQASLQHLEQPDLAAMAEYLKSLPAPQAEPVEVASGARVEAVRAAGKKLYGEHCADCHGDDGKGYPPAYPPLAGNRALLMASAVNPIRLVLHGGFAPATEGNPRPYGMPAYGAVLEDAEVAAIVTYLRTSWGNRAVPVTELEVNRYRGVPLD